MIRTEEDGVTCISSNTVNVEIFAWGLFSRFCLHKNYPHTKIKPICLCEGNRSSIVKITPT